jgi:hypothetical protein
MSLNSKDRQQVVRIAESKGYSPNSTGTALTNGNGGRAKISESGGRVTINGTDYTTPSGARRSTKW